MLIGGPDIDQVQGRGLVAALIGTEHGLAADGHHAGNGFAEGGCESGKHPLKGLRVDMPENIGEDVVTGRAVRQWHKALDQLVLGNAEVGHVLATLGATQDRGQTDE